MSYNLNIRKLEFFKDEFKNCIFISNIKYTWQFILDNKPRTVILIYTKFFGKRVIYLDNKQIYNSSKYTYNFTVSFPIEFHNITITQKDYFYTLKINNISFSNILNDLKLKKFNILEDTYKEKQKEKKLKKLKKRKNRLLLEAINNFNKKDKIHEINLSQDEKNKKSNEESNENIKDNEDEDEDTIHQSFEIHQKISSMISNGLYNINNINNNNNSMNNLSNNKSVSKISNTSNNIFKDKNNFWYKDNNKSFYNQKKSFKSLKKNKNKKNKFNNPSEKAKFKTYENMNSSLNEMIDLDLLENGLNASGERTGTIFRNNLYSSNNRSFFDKGSLTTQSN